MGELELIQEKAQCVPSWPDSRWAFQGKALDRIRVNKKSVLTLHPRGDLRPMCGMKGSRRPLPGLLSWVGV